MKLIKNIFLLGIIGGVVFLLLIFFSPDTSKQIESALGIEGVGDIVRGTKTNIDSAITDIPSVEEFQKGAQDIKDTVSGGIQSTKDTIDTIRSSGQKIENTYNQVVDTYNQARDIVDTASERLEDIQEVVESVNDISTSLSGDVQGAEVQAEGETEIQSGNN